MVNFTSRLGGPQTLPRSIFIETCMSYSTVFIRSPEECNLNYSRIRKSCQQWAAVSSSRCGGVGGEVEEDRERKRKVALQRETRCSSFVSLLFIFQTVSCLTSFQNRELDRNRVLKDDFRKVRWQSVTRLGQFRAAVINIQSCRLCRGLGGLVSLTQSKEISKH